MGEQNKQNQQNQQNKQHRQNEPTEPNKQKNQIKQNEQNFYEYKTDSCTLAAVMLIIVSIIFGIIMFHLLHNSNVLNDICFKIQLEVEKKKSIKITYFDLAYFVLLLAIVIAYIIVVIALVLIMIKDEGNIRVNKLNELNSLRQSFISNPIVQKVNTKTYVKDTKGNIIREEINENNYVELLKKYMDTLVEI